MKLTPIQKLLVLTLAAGGMLAQTASALITIETVPVFNSSVGYDYNIGKYEVTLNQYTAFLNAVELTDTSLYNPSMATDTNVMGISRSGEIGSYTYSVMGDGNRPVTYVSWFETLAFVNWLQNGQPSGPLARGTLQTGAYMFGIGGASFNGERDVSELIESYYLPTMGEWNSATATIERLGNVWEWNEAIGNGRPAPYRGVSGSGWDGQYSESLRIGYHVPGYGFPLSEYNDVGFRIVMIPEPSVVGIMTLGMALVAWKRK